jgi:serine phosphatase RsbU (regulator of sigma subunit)/type II secretory pathway pseudopilin PulG
MTRERPRSSRRVVTTISVIGVVITGTVCWAAWTSNRNNEHRLLQVQTRQAANVVSSAILGIQGPLATALQVASATDGRSDEFARAMSPYTGPSREFVSASLWRKTGQGLRLVSSVGAPAKLPATSPAANRFLARAFASKTLAVTGIPRNTLQRIGYALASQAEPRFAVYAERAIPANRQVPVESDSAFAELNYASYLGPKTRASDLATTDVPDSALPLKGYTVRDSIPFGDTTLTLVASAKGDLGGTLGADLPWIFLLGGLTLTAGAAAVANQLLRRGREAQENAQALSELYGQVDALYGEQRTIAETLQRALLPQSNPSIPNLEIATRYVAGMAGVDIGGDWYSIVRLDDRHFAFVVGDVSGRGIDAATIMARLRFTVRAYLLEGHPPEVALELCGRQLDIEADGHFATVLIGIGDVESRRITLANAGHLEPLIVSGAASKFVSTETGLPLGVGTDAYTSSTVVMPPGSTFVAFTDGLVERRGEGIGAGLNRLAEAATMTTPTLDDLLTYLISEVNQGRVGDDIALLAFKWIDDEQPESDSRPETQAVTQGDSS